MKKLMLSVLTGMLLVACGTPPQAAPQATALPPAPTTVPSPALIATPQPAQRTETAGPQQTAEAAQGQLANVISDQNLSAQQVLALQQTAVAAQRTSAAQGNQLQGVAANQTAAAQQLVIVQQTAEAERQNLTKLQTVVANLVTAQQTAVSAKPSLAPTQVTGTPQSAGTPQPTATKLLYAWFFKRPSEPPQICGLGQGNPCVDSAPNQGTQYISGHVIDQRGMPVAGIIVQARSGSNPLFNTTDATGYYSILLYTNCPGAPQSWDVYIVDGSNRVSSYVQTITYTNCAQAGEFHIDFVEVAH